jgi:hypothetical protein
MSCCTAADHAVRSAQGCVDSGLGESSYFYSPEHTNLGFGFVFQVCVLSCLAYYLSGIVQT